MDENTAIDVNGTWMWYFYICKREVWLMSHSIQPDQDDSNVDLGRFIHENAYARDQKEISIGNIRLDIIRRDKDQIIVGEVKKSSKYRKSAKMQLAFYLLQLSERGIIARGELMFPEEKKNMKVILDDEVIAELNEAKKEILQIVYRDKPPKPEKIKYCKNCAYSELCWA